MRRVFVLAVLLLSAAPVHAKKGHAAAAPKATAASARAMSELAGKFKWGTTHEEVIKIIADNIHEKYVEQIKKEVDVYRQDLLRKQEKEEVDKVRQSLVKFDGQKSGWDTSLID